MSDWPTEKDNERGVPSRQRPGKPRAQRHRAKLSRTFIAGAVIALVALIALAYLA